MNFIVWRSFDFIVDGCPFGCNEKNYVSLEGSLQLVNLNLSTHRLPVAAQTHAHSP